MAKPGPKPKPAAKKRAEGNRGHRPIIDDITAPADETAPPEWLEGDERAMWYKIRPVLVDAGIATDLDNMMLAMLCYYEREHRDIVKAMRDRSLTLSSERTGTEYQDPLVGIRNQTLTRIMKLAALFGMSPSDRTRLSIELNEAVEDGLLTLLHEMHKDRVN